eukprot:Sspe_Gene.71943::Locus_42771_Transcript_1_1_Confidence_1.000_Length_1401::g.71943::m.71943
MPGTPPPEPSEKEATRKSGITIFSPEQRWRLICMGVCCGIMSIFFSTGIAYWAEFRSEGTEYYKSIAHGLLLFALLWAICFCCMGVGLSPATSKDVTGSKSKYSALKLTDEDKKKEEDRTTRDKCIGLLFVCIPCICLIIMASFLGTLDNELYPTISDVKVCIGDEEHTTLNPLLRECTYFGKKPPSKELYLRNCTQFHQLSCCTPREVSQIFTLNAWLNRVSGDRFEAGSCHRMLEALQCWICSPDQSLFYRNYRVKMCTRMCDTVLKVCEGSTFDHHDRTFGDLFGSGTELCEYLQFDVSDCSCYEAYPEQGWDSYGSINWALTTADSSEIVSTPSPLV